jgi:hypothetical protein
VLILGSQLYTKISQGGCNKTIPLSTTLIYNTRIHYCSSLSTISTKVLLKCVTLAVNVVFALLSLWNCSNTSASRQDVSETGYSAIIYTLNCYAYPVISHQSSVICHHSKGVRLVVTSHRINNEVGRCLHYLSRWPAVCVCLPEE